jgi:predicted DNA-binding transcriptional regulator YafY
MLRSKPPPNGCRPRRGRSRRVNEHTCVLHAAASSLDTLSVYLALIGFDFEVLEPPELIDRVRWLAERFNRSIALTRVR